MRDMKSACCRTLNASLRPASPLQANVEAYCKWVLDMAAGAPLMVEQRLPLFYRPDDSGTTDAAAFSPKRIFIGDYKNGAGVSVYAENNKQLAIYAENVIREREVIEEIPEDFPVLLAIYQPNDRNNPKPVREWNTTRGELRRFCAAIQKAADDIDAGKVQFVADPDHQCLFCPAKGICKHYSAYGLSKLDPRLSVEVVTEVQPPKLPDPNSLSRERRNKVLLWKKTITDWLYALEDQEEHELLTGAEPIEFKMVAGKSNRVWTDATEAERLLKNYLKTEQLRPPSDLVSPAAVEKLLKGIETSTRFQNKFATLITKPEGKPTLAPVSDKRPQLTFNPNQGFEKQPEESVI